MITVHVNSVGTRRFESVYDAFHWARDEISKRDRSTPDDEEDESGRPAGVTKQQWAAYSPRSSSRVLAFLTDHKGPAKTAEVVAAVGRTRSTVLRVLQVAEALKLVKRNGIGTGTTWELIRETIR